MDVLGLMIFLDVLLFLFLFINIKHMNNLGIFILMISFIISFLDDNSFEFMFVRLAILSFLIYQTIKIIKIKRILYGRY